MTSEEALGSMKAHAENAWVNELASLLTVLSPGRF